jgi:outer membrane protein OmpA-like peptidoglycan-associated protein
MKHILILTLTATLYFSAAAQKKDSIPELDLKQEYLNLREIVKDSIIKAYGDTESKIAEGVKRLAASKESRMTSLKRKILLDELFMETARNYNRRYLDTAFFYVFDYDQAEAKLSDMSMLKKQLQEIEDYYSYLVQRVKKSHPESDQLPAITMRLSVMGFASPEGPKAYNLKLAERRAEAILKLITPLQDNSNVLFCPIARGEEVLERMMPLTNRLKRSVVLRMDCVEFETDDVCKCYEYEL